ncbi:MAG: QueT transporter family protein [Clostridia bacterium]|nr:QueT transporter family protein [Clostridia bacterium]
MNTRKNRVMHLTYSAIIAALYVALSWVSNIAGLASGAIQLRLSEALCALCLFTPAAVPGMFVGCLISNLTMSAQPLDIVLGSLATLIGAYFGARMKNKYLVPLPTVLANAIVVPLVVLICYTDGVNSLGAYLLIFLGVTVGEILSAYVLGLLLMLALEKRKIFRK